MSVGARAVVAAAVVVLIAAPSAEATPDSLDPGFDSDGIVTTPVGTPAGDDIAQAVAIEATTGKIVLAGTINGEFAVVRLNANGTLDTTFSGDGKVTTDITDPETATGGSDEAQAVAIQADGKIVAAGFADAFPNGGGLSGDFTVVRYNADGTPDTGFDGDGIVRTDVGTFGGPAFAMALQTDGKIVVAGRASAGTHNDFALARYNTNGSLDTNADADPGVHLDGDGTLVTDIRGTAKNDEAKAVAIDSSGAIVAAGYSNTGGGGFADDFAVARYSGTDGSLDTGFDGDGKATTSISPDATESDIANAVAIQSDGKIVAAGQADMDPDNFALVRYNANGSLDTGFDGDGKVTTSLSPIDNTSIAYGVAVRGDGKIAAAGRAANFDPDTGFFHHDFAIARYTAGGALDSTFDGDGKDTLLVAPPGQTDIARGVAFQADNKIVVGGYADIGPPEAIDYDFAAVRYLADGDSIPPAAPTITDTDPDPPANDNNPEVKGTAEAGSTVKIYSSSDCTGSPLGTGTAAAFGGGGITTPVASDQPTNLRATVTDAAGNASACSGPFAYTEDSTAPSAPTLTDTDPDSPANDNNPEVKGTAEAGSTVRLYTNLGCTSAVASQGSAADFASPGLEVTVTDNSSTTFRAKATDAAGNASACSSSFIAYTEDSTGPAAPSITDTDPDPPANDNTPEVKGTVGSGSPTQVKLYDNSSCTGSPDATGTVAQFTGSGITLAVAGDTTTQITARTADATDNESACSSSFAYTEDSTGPAAPSITDTDPDSPANDNTPEVKGTAEAGSTVKIYSSSDCTGTPLATGSAATFGGSGITTPVTGDTTTNLRASATDTVGNVSACSSSFAYTEDSTGPAAPSITDTDPDPPANDNTPEVKGTVGSGSPTQVKLYDNSSCTGSPDATGTVAQFTGSGITLAVAGDTTTQITARTADATDNESACSSSFAYTEDSTGPAAPSITDTDPDSPANDNTPEVKGTAEAGSTVKIYSSSDCTGTPLATGSAATFGGSGITTPVTGDTTTNLRASATDTVGNVSACSSSFAYTEDSTGPAAPSITDTDPDPPANDNTPEVKGTVGSGSPTQVKLYDNSSCTGSPDATGTVAQFTGSGITLAVAGDTTTQITARTADATDNESACSSSFAYTEDSTGPAAPSITDTDPDSPANDNTPLIVGATDAGTTVRLYTAPGCSGPIAAEGTAAAFASPGLLATVAEDSTTTFRATARDGVGNTSACSPGFPYTEDSTAPNTTINTHPPRRTTRRRARFTFDANEAGAVSECKLDRAPYRPCSSPHRTRRLSLGRHVFSVRSTDDVGNLESTPAKWSFRRRRR